MVTQEDLYEAIDEARSNIIDLMDTTSLTYKSDGGIEIKEYLLPRKLVREIKESVDNIISVCAYIDRNFTAIHKCMTEYIKNQKFPKSEEEFYGDYSAIVAKLTDEMEENTDD